MNLRMSLLAAIVALTHTACHTCSPGPFNDPIQCAAGPDAGSPQCAADQSCVPIPSGSANDTRCFSPCKSGQCPSSYVCQPFGIGTGCGRVCDGDNCPDAGVGVQPDCHTRFLCVPEFCK